MLRVKVSIKGAQGTGDISQFTGSEANTVAGCVFHVNADIRDADVWIVSEDVDDWDTVCRVSPDRLVFVTSECSWESDAYINGSPRAVFVKQFAHAYSCHAIYQSGVICAPPFLPWMINANHGPSIFAPHARDVEFFKSLSQIPKERSLSVFCSEQTLTPNHKMRLDFVRNLKEHFGDDLDWFGNGISSIKEKWQGIAPYRYTIVLENRSTMNVWSEKIMDAYLGLAYPIYWGAPNLGEFFDPKSFATINIRDLTGSIEAIEALVASDTAERNYVALMESKRRVIGEYNFFQRLAKVAKEVSSVSVERPKEVQIKPSSSFFPRSNRGVLPKFLRLPTELRARLG